MTVGALSSVTPPCEWSWRPLWDAMPRIKETGQPTAEPLSVFLEAGVVPRGSRSDNHNQLGEDLSKYLVVRPGDVVFNKLRTWQGGLGVSDYYGIVSPAYFVCRPAEQLKARYLHYLLRSTPYIAELTRISKYMPPSQFDTPWDMLRSVPLLTPPLDEQQRIADFLDAETSRIDYLAASLKKFDDDLCDREESILWKLLNSRVMRVGEDLPPSWRWVPLMHLTEYARPIMYGIVLPGPNVPDGVPIVKGGDVAARRLTAGRLNKTTHAIESGYARSRLRGGDLVIAIRGSVGEIAAVPDELTGANLTQDAARISIGNDVDADWLSLVLESPAVTTQIQERVTGATIRGINIWDLKRISIPTPSPGQQRILGEEARRFVALHERLRSKVAQHRALLSERRRALITAAVTGQFDVTTASGRNVTKGVTV